MRLATIESGGEAHVGVLEKGGVEVLDVADMRSLFELGLPSEVTGRLWRATTHVTSPAPSSSVTADSR